MSMEPMPPLNEQALKHLRTIVRKVHTAPPSGIPLAEVLTLPRGLAGGVAITVDFAASRELGHELIVLRVPTQAERKPNPHLAALSTREAEIASQIASGLSNKQIAARMLITLATVKAHVHNILTKTGLPNRTAIAAALLSEA